MQIIENKIKNTLNEINNSIDKPLPNWIPWSNGFFYTKQTNIIYSFFNERFSINDMSSDYSKYYITDEYGDRFYDVPIYSLNKMDEDIEKYFTVEMLKLNDNEQIRIIHFISNNELFNIEQILFKNLPTNCNLIPVLERELKCYEHNKLENFKNCVMLFWICAVCGVKSDHWSKLNTHIC